MVRDAVTEFLHAWVKLDVGKNLLRVVRAKGAGASGFFASTKFKEETDAIKVCCKRQW